MADIDIDKRKLRIAATRRREYHTYARGKAIEVTEVAKSVFNRRQRRDNEDRTSETTPPKYVESFYVERRGNFWVAGNEDPAALWVEFGAHAGGETPVLKYRPITTAIEILAADEAG